MFKCLWYMRCTQIYLYICIYYQGMQSRDFQPTLYKTTQSCAWQQKALWRSWPKPLYKFPYASPSPSSRCPYVGAHISTSAHFITEPEEWAGLGWGPSQGAWTKCKHLTWGKERPCPSTEPSAIAAAATWPHHQQHAALTRSCLTLSDAQKTALGEESC